MCGLVLLILGIVAVAADSAGFETLQSCGQGGVLFVVSFLLLTISWWFVSALLIFHSQKGLPRETEQRRSVPCLLVLKSLLGALTIACNVVGLIWFATIVPSSAPCAAIGQPSLVVFEAAIVIQTLLCAYFVYFNILLCVCHRRLPPGTSYPTHESVGTDGTGAGEVRVSVRDGTAPDEQLETYCTKKCRWFCGCFVDTGGAVAAYDVIGRLLSLIYKDVDLTMDDIALGAWLISLEQESRDREIIGELLKGSGENGNAKDGVDLDKEIREATGAEQLLHSGAAETSFRDHEKVKKVRAIERQTKRKYHFQLKSRAVTFDEANDRHVLEDLLYYYKYALGIYGDLLFTYKRLATCGGCNLLCCSNALCCCAQGSKFVRPSSCVSKSCSNCIYRYGLQYAAFKKESKVRDEDVLYISFKDTVLHSPFAVLLDHEKKKIVVAFRGTISLDDCITDVVAEEMPLDDVGKAWGFDGVGQSCHKGMFDTAVASISTLRKRGLLPGVTSPTHLADGVSVPGDNSIPDKAKEYSYVFCGHSLGAGVACISSLMLKSQIPDIQTLCYSSVPVLSEGLIAQTASHQVGITVGIDLVARLSPRNVWQFRNRVVELLKLSNVKKYKALSAGACGCYIPIEKALPTAAGDAPTDAGSAGDLPVPVRPFYHGGKLIHATQLSEATSCMSRRCACLNALCCDPNREYELNWVEDNTKEFQEIIVGPRMAADHFPDVLAVTFGRISKKYNMVRK